MKLFSKNRKKCNLKIHLVMVTKYRKRLFINDELNLFMKNQMKLISMRYTFIIVEMESDINHMHLLITYPPTVTVSSIVRLLKQQSTYNIWLEFETILQNEFYKERTFWSDGYYVDSVGSTSEDNIIKYIRNQGK